MSSPIQVFVFPTGQTVIMGRVLGPRAATGQVPPPPPPPPPPGGGDRFMEDGTARLLEDGTDRYLE